MIILYECRSHIAVLEHFPSLTFVKHSSFTQAISTKTAAQLLRIIRIFQSGFFGNQALTV